MLNQLHHGGIDAQLGNRVCAVGHTSFFTVYLPKGAKTRPVGPITFTASGPVLFTCQRTTLSSDILNGHGRIRTCDFFLVREARYPLRHAPSAKISSSSWVLCSKPQEDQMKTPTKPEKPPVMKTCSQCGQYAPHNWINGAGRYRYRCQTCHNNYNRQYRQCEKYKIVQQTPTENTKTRKQGVFRRSTGWQMPVLRSPRSTLSGSLRLPPQRPFTEGHQHLSVHSVHRAAYCRDFKMRSPMRHLPQKITCPAPRSSP